MITEIVIILCFINIGTGYKNIWLIRKVNVTCTNDKIKIYDLPLNSYNEAKNNINNLLKYNNILIFNNTTCETSKIIYLTRCLSILKHRIYTNIANEYYIFTNKKCNKYL
ncbi:hypothetical protein [Alphaentomopoxvirus acuprea]|uniref:Uncharacterized protein n=1 Tax=Alphaentomopoxvirus acuprea TaxID=62099 RepID=W6JIY4_9POXV|nr:hypothetical protein BA82_gp208 [Anomala cuprea entomopoxvirus]BAO49568.1 hypothetical protein [Anomala cuprea entomopoxvirus]